MDAGDWIALAAVVLSVGAAVVSIHQAKTAKQSADLAEVQAEAAKEANQLTRQQMAQQAIKDHQEAAEAMNAAQREAEKVRIDLGGNGGSLTVHIVNHARRLVTDVELLDVAPLDEGPWCSWQVNPNVNRQFRALSRPLMHPDEGMTIAVWLLDEDGVHVREVPRTARVKVRFRDDDGQWWLAANGEDIQRIALPAP